MMRAKTVENSKMYRLSSTGDGNMPMKGVKSGVLVAYSQFTNGAAGLAPKNFRIKRKPNINSTMVKAASISDKVNDLAYEARIG